VTHGYGIQRQENVMSEFGQIFGSNLTVAIYVYGSLAAFAAYAIVAPWLTPVADSWPAASASAFSTPAPAGA
jgi:hypothetical protein